MVLRLMAIIGIALSLLTGCAVTEEVSMGTRTKALADAFAGYWEGTLDIGQPTGLTIGFELVQNTPEDQILALLHIPRQGVRGIEVDISINEEFLTIGMPALMATYRGSLDEESQVIEGTFSQMGQTLSLRLERSEHKDDRRIQDPVPPYPYVSEDLRFEQLKEGFILAGTLTRPKGPGTFPAVVLISGSGSQNRDEEIFGHRPFLVLADALTRAGIVVLRYDDRGFAESEGDASEATTVDLADDAESAVAYLSNLPYVDQANIGLIGHSEGGIIAPIIARRNSGIAFIILMAGSGVDGISTLADQTAAILGAQGAPQEVIAQTVATNLSVYHTIIDETKGIEERKSLVRQSLLSLGLPEAQADAQMTALFSPWYMTFLALDPSEYLREVTVPVMILNGTKDTQVSASLHMDAIIQALAEGGNERIFPKVYEGLNHLFQPAKSGDISEYGSIDITMDPQVLTDIVWWIQEGRFQL